MKNTNLEWFKAKGFMLCLVLHLFPQKIFFHSSIGNNSVNNHRTWMKFKLYLYYLVKYMYKQFPNDIFSSLQKQENGNWKELKPWYPYLTILPGNNPRPMYFTRFKSRLGLTPIFSEERMERAYVLHWFTNVLWPHVQTMK